MVHDGPTCCFLSEDMRLGMYRIGNTWGCTTNSPTIIMFRLVFVSFFWPMDGSESTEQAFRDEYPLCMTLRHTDHQPPCGHGTPLWILKSYDMHLPWKNMTTWWQNPKVISSPSPGSPQASPSVRCVPVGRPDGSMGRYGEIWGDGLMVIVTGSAW